MRVHIQNDQKRKRLDPRSLLYKFVPKIIAYTFHTATTMQTQTNPPVVQPQRTRNNFVLELGAVAWLPEDDEAVNV